MASVQCLLREGLRSPSRQMHSRILSRIHSASISHESFRKSVSSVQIRAFVGDCHKDETKEEMVGLPRGDVIGGGEGSSLCSGSSEWTKQAGGEVVSFPCPPQHGLSAPRRNSSSTVLTPNLLGEGSVAMCSRPRVGPSLCNVGIDAAYSKQFQCQYQHQPSRTISSVSDMIPSVPEFAQHWTVWGGSGWLLKTLHFNGTVPYWACMSLTNVIVRTSLIPLVLDAAHTSVRFAKVAPEVQFLVTSFQKDLKVLREQKRPPREQMFLIRTTYQTLRQIYRLHKVNPLSVFKSPLMQIPVFWYFSVDIRKIINGADPALAQDLTESGFLWVADLTEPDPWYGLPIMSGLLLYLNVEVAMGKQSLSGETTSKSNVARVLKDFFQSLAVFMPCFMSQSPAGVQIYLLTSFVFTLFQGSALRNDQCRSLVGLPARNAPAPEPVLVKQFMELKKTELEAAEARGDRELLGKGVLAHGFQTSFEGSARPSTIAGSAGSGTVLSIDNASKASPIPDLKKPSMVVPVDQPLDFKDGSSEEDHSLDTNDAERDVMPQIPDDVMEAANRGVIMAPPDEKKGVKTLNVKKFVAKKRKQKLKKGLKKPSGRKR